MQRPKALGALAFLLIAGALLLWMSGAHPASAQTTTDHFRCEHCLQRFGCDTDATRCITDCRGRYPDAPVSLDLCVNGCNQTVDICLDQAQMECGRLRECP